jgi:aldose 1-epimerase
VSSPDESSIAIHRLVHAGARGKTTAVVVPAWGANILAFAFQPQDLMWPVPFLEAVDIASVALKPTSYGAPLLAPTPGRIGATEPGAFRFDGRDYRLAQARHGFLRNLAWRVVERTESALTCGVEVRPAESLGTFPFAFTAEHRVEVQEGCLDACVEFRATGDVDQPISMGWHPYLQRDSGCRLHIPAASVWEVDGSPEPVPTGRLTPVAGVSDFRAGRVLPADEHWDVTLTDLTADPRTGIVRSWLESDVTLLGADGRACPRRVTRAVEASPSAGLGNVQLYTAPGRSAIAVEPFSSPPDALNLLARGHDGTGIRRLRRGEGARYDIRLRLSVDPL